MTREDYSHDRAELTSQLGAIQTEHALATPGSVEANASGMEVTRVHALRVALDIAFMKAQPAITGVMGINI